MTQFSMTPKYGPGAQARGGRPHRFPPDPGFRPAAQQPAEHGGDRDRGSPRQRPDRRIPDRATLKREATVWQEERNAERAKPKRRLMAADARIRLKSLSRTFSMDDTLAALPLCLLGDVTIRFSPESALLRIEA